jgi:DNA repair protein RecN (Recombination protein N)
MLRELHIKNFALIDELHLEFESGFSVFTGETGAGKSILIGTIGFILGGRASAETIRAGADETELSGVFECASLPPALEALLAEHGIESDDNAIIIRRTISRNGRNRLRINQVPVPLSILKALGDLLVDFHGQHEHQSLLKPETPRILIDSLPGAAAAKTAYDKAYADYASRRAALAAHNKKATELAQKRDLLEFQHNELSALELKAGEEQQLEEEIRIIASLSERMRCASAVAQSLEGNEEADSLERRLWAIKKNLDTLAQLDSAAATWAGDIDSLMSFAGELERFISSYLQNAESQGDSARLDTLNSRLAKLQRLKKKHHCTVDELIEKRDQLARDLASLENIDADRALLQKQLSQAHSHCMRRGEQLSTARKKAGAELDGRVGAGMSRLGFTEGQWRTVYTPENEPMPTGLESVAFEVRTNPGEPFLPLAKTASGGEISRLMLAVKSFLAEKDYIPVLIFDEIDAGIGGVLAKEVAAALKKLSKTHQVLCISHLHQIASIADAHYLVHKSAKAGRTVTRARRLSGDEKVDEISRMLGGKTEISEKHARELLKQSTNN